MTVETQNRRNHGFFIGLLSGTVVGAGLAMWFAPRLAGESRERIRDSARGLNNRTSRYVQDASAGVRETLDDLTTRSRGVRNDAADAVARGAREVERMATSLKG